MHKICLDSNIFPNIHPNIYPNITTFIQSLTHVAILGLWWGKTRVLM